MMQLLGILLAWSIQSASNGPASVERRPLALSEFEGLVANNIFSPAKVKRPEVRSRPPYSTPSEPAKPRPKPPVVTGFILEPGTTVYRVIIEDRNTDEKLKHFKEPKFLKAGDELLGWKVEAVGAQSATVRHGETVKELRTGESLPENGAAAPAASAAPSEPKPAEPAPVPSDSASILEELKRKRNKQRSEEDFKRPD